MDAVVTDSERPIRSAFYLSAYGMARERIEQRRLGDDRPDSGAVLRRLVAMISREMGDDGAARRVIGLAVEEAVAGWSPPVAAGRANPSKAMRPGSVHP